MTRARRPAAATRAVGEAAGRERDLLAAVLDVVGALVVVLDTQGRIVRFNRACESVTGYRFAEVEGRPIWDLLLPEEAESVRAVFAHLAAGQFPSRHENYWRTKSGGSRLIAWTNTALTDERGAVRLVVGTGIDVTEQRRAEERLRESEAQYRSLIDEASDGVVITDEALRVLDVNPRGCELLGYSREELLTLSVVDLLTPETLVSFPLQFEELKQGRAVLAERVVQRKDGSCFPVETSSRLLPTGLVLSFVRDITQRKRTDLALRESEERFRRVIESDMLGIVFLSAEGSVVDANDYFLGLLGYTRDDVRAGRVSWERIVPPGNAGGERAAGEEAVSAGGFAAVERELVRADGRLVPVLVGGALLQREDGMRVCFLLDLTKRKHAEQRLAESERYLERAQELAHVGTWQVDVATATATLSDEMARIQGLPPGTRTVSFDEALQRVHPEDRALVLEHARRGIENAASSRYEHRMVRPDGAVRMVEVISEPVLDASGKVASLIGSLQDVTERRFLELQLREAQKLEAIGRLAGGVAHDFNNLLTVILGFSEVLLAELPAQVPQHGSAGEIRAAALRAAGLTQQLLAFARRQMLQPRVIDLNAVVADMRNILDRLAGERIEVVATPGARRCLVRADRGQIEQVIMNLALNARDAMPAGGRLEIATHDVEGPHDGPPGGAGEEPLPGVLLMVSDTGVGMSPDVQAHIFEPFYTTKEVGQGTGLGLATVYGIVAQTGGRIEVSSAPGAGTTFRIILPVTDEPLEAEGSASPSSVPRGRETVLLVEDEAAVRRLMADVLGRGGYHVLEAADGREAIDVATRHAGPIHLLVSDVVLPGPTGHEVARCLRLQRPGLKALFVSGYSDEAAGEPVAGSQSGAFLQKPFAPDTLARRVRELLDAPDPGPPGR